MPSWRAASETFAFERHAAEAEDAWHAFFAPRILQLRDMTREDMDAVPTPPPFSATPAPSGIMWPALGMSIWTLVATVLLVASRAQLRA